MKTPAKDERITASELGLRDLPPAWRGATLEQMVNSAEKVVDQSAAIGGSQDPRLHAALRILEFTKRLEKAKSK